MGVTSAGRRVIDAAVTGDEDTSNIAGIFLTRAGGRAIPLIAEALASGVNAPILVDVLASIGTDTALKQLRTLTDTTNPDIAHTAKDAVARLERRRKR